MAENTRTELPDYVELPAERGPAGRERYGWIDFSELPNTRDLGGLIGDGGRRVKAKRLLRSGALGFGSRADIERLRDEFELRLVVDLRNDTERSELPDPMDLLPKTRYVQANILTKGTAGITQEHDSREIRRMKEAIDAHDSEHFMALLYPHMLFSDSGMKGYRELFASILGAEQGCSLWHCYVGRDRCGLGSVLIESALGVSLEDMESDYLATNRFAPIDFCRDTPASSASFHSALDAVDRECGGYLGYIEKMLEISESDIDELRARYLESA